MIKEIYSYGDTYDTKAAKSEEADGALLADGFEGALLGFGYQFNYPVAVYSRSRCMDILITRDDMSYEEALEYFDFNVSGAYAGKSTPIFMDDEFDIEE